MWAAYYTISKSNAEYHINPDLCYLLNNSLILNLDPEKISQQNKTPKKKSLVANDVKVSYQTVPTLC